MSRKMIVELATRLDNRGLKQASKSFKDFSVTALGMKFAIGAAALKLAQFSKEAILAAAEEEQAYAKLGKTLSNLGFDKALPGVRSFISAEQFAAAVSEDQLIPAYQTLLNNVQDVTAAEGLLKLAVDASASSGRDLGTVTGALGKAFKGNYVALGRLGIGLDAATLKAGDLTAILADLTNRTRGAAAAGTDTFAGKLEKVKLAGDEAKESIGVGLIGAFANLAGNGDIDAANAKLLSFSDTLGSLISGAGSILGKIVNSKFFNLPLTISKAINPQIWESKASLDAEKARRATIKVMTASYKEQAAIAKTVAKTEAARKKAAAEASAKSRAEAAQKLRQANLDKKTAELAMQYDVERAGLIAASSRTQTADTKQRLMDLLAINTALYAQDLGLTSMEEIWKLINEQVKKYTDQILASIAAANAAALAAAQIAAAYATAGSTTSQVTGTTKSTGAGQISTAQNAFANATPGSAAQFRAAEVLAGAANTPSNLDSTLNAYLNATPGSAAQFRAADQLVGTTVNLTVQGSVIAEQDLTDAVTKAVYSASYQGALNKLKANPALADF